MTILLIIVCNALLLGGLWMSGVDLDIALSKPELYDPENGHCLRVGFAKVEGAQRPIQLCTEWLELSDPSGNTHHIREGIGLVMGADGQLYYQARQGENFRLIALLMFVIVVIGSGMWAKRFLISWYQLQLQSLGKNS
ncbi:MAG: hypothetical protein JSU59_11180 [Nitrospirota bacterium]|nr:MAG: hypothetical protein JSU59_11180 [Nitrospirota bacterium]